MKDAREDEENRVRLNTAISLAVGVFAYEPGPEGSEYDRRVTELMSDDKMLAAYALGYTDHVRVAGRISSGRAPSGTPRAVSEKARELLDLLNEIRPDDAGWTVKLKKPGPGL